MNGPLTPSPVRRSLPNLISFSRLSLALAVICAILSGAWRAAVVLLLAAALSDVLDGFLARRWGVASRLGAYLDPIADKVLLSGTFLGLGVAGALPWWLVGLVFGRDVLILGGALVMMRWRGRRDFSPSAWGKLSTVIQALTGGLALLARAWPEWGLTRLVGVLVWLAAAATLWSGLDYARQALRGGGTLIDGMRRAS